MLRNIIEKAQNADKEAMLELIQKFNPLLNKYGKKLNYEDAYADVLLYFIQTINLLKVDNLVCNEDGAIVNYINIAICNFYNKKISNLINLKNEIKFIDLTEEQLYYVEAISSSNDKEDIFLELGLNKILTGKEYEIIYLIFVQGYNSVDVAKTQRKTRQAVNQIKKRALDKIKKYLTND